jgi:hypothetical protein
MACRNGSLGDASDSDQSLAHCEVQWRAGFRAKNIFQTLIAYTDRSGPEIAHLHQFAEQRHEGRQQLHEQPWSGRDLVGTG